MLAFLEDKDEWNKRKLGDLLSFAFFFGVSLQIVIVESSFSDSIFQSLDPEICLSGSSLVIKFCKPFSQVSPLNFTPGAVLLGDAAHCTGGVSGQGCSSAMKDTPFPFGNRKIRFQASLGATLVPGSFVDEAEAAFCAFFDLLLL